jgi:peptide/nickel transport system substrate-binding protein
MSRQRPRPARLLAVGAVAVLAFASCGDTTVSPTPSASRGPEGTADTSGLPIARPSSGPFEPMSYPADGPAPCEQPSSDDPALGPYEGSIRRIRAKDDRIVVFELCDSDPAFLAKIATPALTIDDTAWLQSRIDPTADRQRIVTEVNGTGPFWVDHWDGNSDVALARFDGYWGPAASVGAVIFVGESDVGRRLDKLREGSVDGVDLVAPSDVESVQANPELNLVHRNGLNTAYIGLNNNFAPFDSEAVRRAIAVGIDRGAILDASFPPGTDLASHFLPCAIQFGCAGASWPQADPALGRDILADAGFPDGFATTITYSDEPRDYLPVPAATATALQAQLRDQLGIEATLKMLPFDELTAMVDRGRVGGLYLLGARARYPDSSLLLEGHFGPDASLQFGRRFDDIARALAQGRSSADPKVREQGYSRTNARILTHVPMIPLAHVGSAGAFRTDVTGATITATASERFTSVVPGDRTQFVFMQDARPAGLYCPDETTDSTLRVCAQLAEPLYRFDVPEPKLAPALAERCAPDRRQMVWTCTLRAGVRFHDGAMLDANDVVLSFAIQWDATHPLHRGRTGTFQAFLDRFGGFLNPPAAQAAP